MLLSLKWAILSWEVPRKGSSGFASLRPQTWRPPGWSLEQIKEPQIIPEVPSCQALPQGFTQPVFISVSPTALLSLPIKTAHLTGTQNWSLYIKIFIHLSNGRSNRGTCTSHTCPSHPQPSESCTPHCAEYLAQSTLFTHSCPAPCLFAIFRCPADHWEPKVAKSGVVTELRSAYPAMSYYSAGWLSLKAVTGCGQYFHENQELE